MKCKLLLLCVVILGSLAFGATNFGGCQAEADAIKEKPGPDPAHENLAKLAKKRYEAGQKAYKETYDRAKNGFALDLPLVYLLSTNLLNSHIDFKKGDSLAPFLAHFERMLELERILRALEAKGGAQERDVFIVQTFRLEAEYWLERAKPKKAP